ncbi:MAG: ABC transporter permease [Coriobacteriia bacterium]|nr:ABC transporter permease [Coriobacteriia bacterium]MCL2749468.1 ABC transporter permease [Coriobacteriia bacterium]
MRSALALTLRILQQFRHDPRTVVMFIVGPFLVLWLFSVLLTGGTYEPRLAGVDLPTEITSVLQEQDATFEALDAATAAERLANREIDAILTLKDGTLLVEVEGTDTSHTSSVIGVVNNAIKEVAANQREELADELKLSLEKLNIPLPQMDDALLVQDVEVTYLHGSDNWSFFDFFGPIFIGVFIFVFVFITSGMSLITERTGGTMERLLATPIKSWQLVLGFCLGFGVVSIIQASIVLWACIALIGFPNAGSLLTVICITASLALVSLTLGLLVSGFARTPLQVIQFMIILVIPQVLFSGIFDLTTAPQWMQILNKCFPITYGAEALQDVMLRGASFVDILPQLAILWAFIAAFFALASLSFKKRKTS